ncbi:hypothetical protein KFK09_026809 [Dendrobium nobile]|uniref:Uncharacterized protein n=1 Tax=Dendrobium nobile TaxID=94219 RepID=A0A8T3A7L1_DENNO|nr:hypothetical protein KFK09_026809 [Dendrobium nobile]
MHTIQKKISKQSLHSNFPLKYLFPESLCLGIRIAQFPQEAEMPPLFRKPVPYGLARPV